MNHFQAVFLTGWVFVIGCITVNINFPPKEVEKAAEVIVGEARPIDEGGDGVSAPDPSADGGSGQATEPPPPPPPPPEAPPSLPPAPEGSSTLPGADQKSAGASGERGADHFLLASFPAGAGAAEEKKESPPPSDIKINIETPIIKKIRESLNARFSKLDPFYNKGPIGETYDGYCEIRDESKLGIAEKRDLKALVAEENTDRKNLYLEIVKENHFDESRLKDVERIFAVKWAEKSRTGWWIQRKEIKRGDNNEEIVVLVWEKKPPPPKAGKKAAKKA